MTRFLSSPFLVKNKTNEKNPQADITERVFKYHKHISWYPARQTVFSMTFTDSNMPK